MYKKAAHIGFSDVGRSFVWNDPNPITAASCAYQGGEQLKNSALKKFRALITEECGNWTFLMRALIRQDLSLEFTTQ